MEEAPLGIFVLLLVLSACGVYVALAPCSRVSVRGRFLVPQAAIRACIEVRLRDGRAFVQRPKTDGSFNVKLPICGAAQLTMLVDGKTLARVELLQRNTSDGRCAERLELGTFGAGMQHSGTVQEEFNVWQTDNWQITKHHCLPDAPLDHRLLDRTDPMFIPAGGNHPFAQPSLRTN